ncbi:hypothetical protein [Clostridium sp.]|uniref:hypothetical protein n=1 Tax=Clostridium sp. TaxID=1506 RepID=UPI002848B2F7|nr:hypothetical protein [Clostridium sp.]MDR3598486.1 hypothetical protein [Clostridium sp.]
MNIIIIVIVSIVLVIGIPFSILKDIKYKEKHKFQCTKCSYVYDIIENQCNSFRILGKLHVKCPKCGKYSRVKIIKKE